jgi:hypothetical protein
LRRIPKEGGNFATPTGRAESRLIEAEGWVNEHGGTMSEYQRLRPAFILLHVTLGIMLGLGGAATAWTAYREPGRPHAAHLVGLGAFEAVAAVFFLLPRTLRLGAGGLLLSCGLALAAHLSLGEWRSDLVVYMVAVLFVAVHGAAYRVAPRLLPGA